VGVDLRRKKLKGPVCYDNGRIDENSAYAGCVIELLARLIIPSSCRRGVFPDLVVEGPETERTTTCLPTDLVMAAQPFLRNISTCWYFAYRKIWMSRDDTQ